MIFRSNLNFVRISGETSPSELNVKEKDGEVNKRNRDEKEDENDDTNNISVNNEEKDCSVVENMEPKAVTVIDERDEVISPD